VIIKVKSWLIAISTPIIKGHIQAYFDEFSFRINRAEFKTNIFHKTIDRTVESRSIYQNQIKQTLTV
jgi:hypothetical protein